MIQFKNGVAARVVFHTHFNAYGVEFRSLSSPRWTHPLELFATEEDAWRGMERLAIEAPQYVEPSSAGL